jgi:hypothetical protein
MLRVRSNAPPAFTTIVWDGMRILSSGHHEPDFTVQAPDMAAEYRVEVRATGRGPEIPWLLSNPIYVRGPAAVEVVPAGATRRVAATSVPIFDGTSNGWRVEHDPVSLAALDVSRTIDGSELRLRYALAADAGPSVALINDRPAGLAPNVRLTFTARAEHPMRISVQFRTGAGPSAERWQRSVFVDTYDQERTIFFDDLSPIGTTRTPLPVLSDVHDILFVIESTNTQPGASGRLWIKGPAVQR